MTPEKTERLKVLQNWPRCLLDPGAPGHAADCEHNPAGRGRAMELAALRRELALEPEVADDPATPFVDESRRPLTTGGDSLQRFKDEDWADALAHAEAFALKFGVALAKAALESVLKGR